MSATGAGAGRLAVQLAELEAWAHPEDLSHLRCDLITRGMALIGEDGRRIAPGVPVKVAQVFAPG